REAILLCDVEGQTQAAAARRLGCPEGTVAARLSRGRALLAARLARRGVGLPAAGLAAGLWETAGAGATGLMARPIRVAGLGAGGAPAGAVPDRVGGLANGGITTMLGMKLKAAVAALSVVGLIALGAGLGPVLAGKPQPPVTAERRASDDPFTVE